MEVEIVEKKENKLMNRIEVRFRVDHPGEATPKREEIKKKVSAILGAKEDFVILRKIVSTFGKPVSYGIVHVYNNKEDIFRWEPRYILKRNGLVE